MKRSLSLLCVFLFSGLFLLAVADTTPKKEAHAEQTKPEKDTTYHKRDASNGSAQQETQHEADKSTPAQPDFNDFNLFKICMQWV